MTRIEFRLCHLKSYGRKLRYEFKRVQLVRAAEIQVRKGRGSLPLPSSGYWKKPKFVCDS
jgi:hypothetical protein